MNLPPRVGVIGSRISACDMSTAVGLLEARVHDGGGGYVCFTNVHATVLGRRDRSFREITNSSFLSVADGKPIYWLGRAKRNRAIGHVPGPDFFITAIRQLPQRRHFLYGSTPAVLSQLVSQLERVLPSVQVCGTLSPPFRELTPEDKQQHYRIIRESGADFVWVGRPFLYAAIAGGEAGVARAISLLHAEIDRDLALLGIRSISEITPDLVRKF